VVKWIELNSHQISIVRMPSDYSQDYSIHNLRESKFKHKWLIEPQKAQLDFKEFLGSMQYFIKKIKIFVAI